MLIPNKFNGYSRDGRRIYFFDLGGGGGGGGSSPVSSTTQTQDLPDWAKGPAQDVLAKGAALTDTKQNPYQAYGGNRIAGFSDLQNQSFNNAANMTVAPQVGQGTAAAIGAGLGGANVAGQANTQGFQNQMGGYMNPYMNQILAPQLAEANRNYDIGATKQQSAATQAGAFGGSREAIMAAENERNRNTGLNQIYGQGMNNAYNQAQQQYNQNLQNQLAGYGLMGNAANSLGQLGQNQYQQQMGITGMQNQYGGQEQAQTQRGLDTAYNDFLTQKNYPYQQLSYMSNLIRGTPMGMNTASQVYQAPPSTAQALGALGMGAYGAKQLFSAKGGLMEAYANGGEVHRYNGEKDSVTSSDNIESIIGRLNPQQLHDALQNAQARGDDKTVAAITARLDALAQVATNKAMANGSIAGAMPEQMADGIVNAAGGGILAFANGGTKHFDGEDGSLVQIPQYAGDPALYKKFGNRAMESIDAYSNLEAPKAYTPQEEEALDARSMERAKKLIGPSPYAGMASQLEELKTQSKEALQQGKGLAALAAIDGMLQPGGALRGFGRAGKDFAQAYAPAVRADQDLKKSTALMNINLANAQRAENMGLGKEAMAYTNQAIAARKDAGRAERELLQKKAELDLKGATAFRPPSRGSGAGGAGKKDKYAEEYYAQEKAFAKMKPTDEGYDQARIELEAARKAVDRLKTSDIGGNKAAAAAATLTGSQNRKLSDHMSNFTNSTAYKKALRTSQAEADTLYDTEQTRKTTELMQGIPTGGASVGGSGSNVTRSNF